MQTDAMAKRPRTVIIGLDGVPFGMIEDFAETGIMPNTADVISQGVFKRTKSSLPEVSSVAWSSIISGENPGRHGIFGFMDLVPGSYKMNFPNYNDLKAPPFWDQWQGKSVIINVPSTYPVREMNGVHISGFVSIDFKKSVHPKSLIPQLNDLDYRLDVDARKAHSSMDQFLEDLAKTIEARIEAYRYLWDYCDWQSFMFVFTATDRLLHFLWDAYEDTSHRYHNVFLDHFRKIDKTIGEIAARLTDEDLLVILSDHGFERLESEVYISHLLVEEGFLQFKQGAEVAMDNICYGTKAFVLDPGRIYLNLKGKYPCGTVDSAETEDLLCRLESLFGSLKINGKSVIKDIYRKEQIYSGPYLEDAPDLVLVGAEGFNLKANVKTKQLSDKGIFSGKHTHGDAFLIVKGLSDKSLIPDIPVVWDIKQIIEKSKSCS